MNATNMCIMNTEGKRKGDFGIFGVRITEFRVALERYEHLKFAGLFCGFF
jgi:hypothetical protein